MVELSDSQRGILVLAAANDGRVERSPDNLQGGARTSLMRGLLRNALVEPHDAGYRLTEAGWAAIGYEWRADNAQNDAACGDNGGHVNHAASDEPAGSTTAPTTASKQSRLELVVGLLSRPMARPPRRSWQRRTESRTRCAHSSPAPPARRANR